jgi:hypothetical protein
VIVRLPHAAEPPLRQFGYTASGPSGLERARLPYGRTMPPCVTVLLPARGLARIARENPNYALARRQVSATGESPAERQTTFGAGRAFQRAVD